VLEEDLSAMEAPESVTSDPGDASYC
jgi:hypothetical protein